MIQRIQSIFLLLAGAASLSLFGLPFATTPQVVQGSTLFADAAYRVQDQVGLMVLFGLAGVLAIGGIFLYKNRALQMRLSIFSIIATVLAITFGIIYFMQNSQDIGNTAVNDGLGLYFPVAALVFALLAYRFISKDDKLVKSMDRLR
ncbi:MAG TPA: DUF4293 domain-containing protein [Saprospiraceae bacterium]|nr:DUF4293 domain-containing protein [Saprospiraceae bacterium]HMQ83722.1 DUF4293 domain-containing protein [Saprospiraceae bacterium]